jgi:hypothetical protein
LQIIDYDWRASAPNTTNRKMSEASHFAPDLFLYQYEAKIYQMLLHEEK